MEKVPKRPGRRKKQLSNLKGQKIWQKRLKINESGDDGNMDIYRDYSRMAGDVYDIADNDDLLKPCYLRPSASKKGLTELYFQSKEEEIIGNRLVSMAKMSILFNACNKGHRHMHPECPGEFLFPGSEEVTKGICTSVCLKCNTCNYRSNRMNMYEEINATQAEQHGRRAAKPNIQLTHFLSKSPISQSDILLLFASIDATCFSASGLQKSITQCSKTWTLANMEQMEENREILKDIVSRKEGRPTAEFTEVAAEIDTSYSSPPKGRAMSQPANQSLTPLLENNTKKKMLIGLTSISKLCSHGNGCNGHHEGCGRNWEPSKPISNSETDAGRQMYLENINSGIKITEIVHDGVMPNSHAKGMTQAAQQKNQDGPESQLCTIHLSRGLKRRAFNMKISNELAGPNLKIRKTFVRKLALAIDKRCTCELARAQKKFGEDPEKFKTFMEAARMNILQCYSGDHSSCKRSSLACKHQSEPDKLPTFLPHSQYLVLGDADQQELQKIVDYKISPSRVQSQRYMRHTNKVEAFHLRCLKSTPKTKTCKRHYAARNHSAAHNASIGIGNSILKLNEYTGSALKSGGKAITILHRVTKRVDYNAKRQKGLLFKQSRKRLRERRLKEERISRMSTSDGPSCSSILSEHAYAE